MFWSRSCRCWADSREASLPSTNAISGSHWWWRYVMRHRATILQRRLRLGSRCCRHVPSIESQTGKNMETIVTSRLESIRLGEVQRHKSIAILPLFSPDGRFAYRTLGESLSSSDITITEVSGSGSVPELVV